jgi:hypothetical protein
MTIQAPRKVTGGRKQVSNRANAKRVILVLSILCYLKTLSESGLYSVWDRMIKEQEADGDVKIGRGTEVLGENLSQCHFVPHKSYMT